MLKIFKWLWDKAETQGREKARAEIYGLRTYHIQKAEIAMLKKRYEPDEPKYKDDIRDMFQPRLSPQEHSAIANELGRMINNWESQDEVNHGR